MPCAALAALMLACLGGYVPDISKPIPIPYRCVKKLGDHRAKAETCAAEYGVTWRIVGKRKKK